MDLEIRDRPEPSGRGRYTQLVEAVYASAESGKSVYVKCDDKSYRTMWTSLSLHLGRRDNAVRVRSKRSNGGVYFWAEKK